MTPQLAQLSSVFPHLVFKPEESLALYTAVKIGGPAELFCQVQASSTLEDLVKYCCKNTIAYTILGWGANTLISDRGLRGLVIKNNSKLIKIEDQVLEIKEDQSVEQPAARWQADQSAGTFKYDFNDINYDESGSVRVRVTMDSGVPLAFAMTQLINQGITGFQWYARIPATIGGAVYNNIHGGTHFLSEIIESVRVVNKVGEVYILPVGKLELGYDYSKFHHSQETILEVTFLLYKGDANRAKEVMQEWGKRKAPQPAKSLGCIFQNITTEQQEELSLPTPSVGYIIEHVLERKGWQVGEARVSPYHAAFIENVGAASATDYLFIIKTIIAETKKKLGVDLQPEIFFLGFQPSELEGVV